MTPFEPDSVTGSEARRARAGLLFDARLRVLVAIGFVATVVASLDRSRAEAKEASDAQGSFVPIARVLLSPRCRNCHPIGDAPLQGDRGTPHTMNVTRKSPSAGLACTTCHRDKNAPMLGGPPGVHGWRMPETDVPMVFQGLSPKAICEKLKDPQQTRGRDLAALREHMAHDELVLWGWNPGPGRTKPPISHEELVKAVDRWIALGAPCPAE